MNIDLRGARERAGLTQSQLATMLELSQAQVSRYEQDPGTISTELLVRWAQAIGTDIPTLLANALPALTPLQVSDPYANLRHDLNLLEQYISAAHSSELDTVKSHLTPDQLPTPDNLRLQIKRYRQKPNLVLVGRFDSGKSHLANALIGIKCLPSQYQPATRVITFVRHIDDRPTWLSEQVCILDEEFWPKDEKGNFIFDLTTLDSQERYEDYCINSGSLEVLREHGLHDHLSEDEIDGHSAVVYIDSPLLKACNVVDFPGYSDKSDEFSGDVKKANSAAQIADLVLYTSPANNFINAEDIQRLSYLLKVLPTPETAKTDFPKLGNLFIVATHASPSINDSQLEQIMKVGPKRFYKELNEFVFSERGQRIGKPITPEEVSDRFFTFWSELPNRCKKLREDLTVILEEHFPKVARHNIECEISEFKYKVPKNISNQILAYQQTIAEIEQRRQELQQLEKEQPNFQSKIKLGRKKIHQRISELQSKSKTSFQSFYNDLLIASTLEEMIRKRYDNKKEAQEYAVGYVVEKLQTRLEVIIKENSEVLKKDIDEFLELYEEALLKLPKLNADSVHIPFDPKGAFLGGIVGLGGVGALAVWAAALGNLGAYILVAKGVSLLAALGIGVGGVANAVAFVAAIGGPIALAVGIVAIAAFVGWALFGESWQSRLAKKIVSHFQEQRVLNQYLKGNDDYWNDTSKAFDKGADALEEKFDTYMHHLREITSNNPKVKHELELLLNKLKGLQNFFEQIPWVFQFFKLPVQSTVEPSNFFKISYSNHTICIKSKKTSTSFEVEDDGLWEELKFRVKNGEIELTKAEFEGLYYMRKV